MVQSIITAAQIEALENSKGSAQVFAAPLEAMTVQANQPANVLKIEVEAVGVQANQPAKIHSAVVESVGVQADQPANIHAIYLEAMRDNPATVAIHHMSIEVMRTPEGKRRRPPIHIVAN